MQYLVVNKKNVMPIGDPWDGFFYPPSHSRWILIVPVVRIKALNENYIGKKAISNPHMKERIYLVNWYIYFVKPIDNAIRTSFTFFCVNSIIAIRKMIKMWKPGTGQHFLITANSL